LTVGIAQYLVNAHTEYGPLPGSNPLQYTQDTYTANFLQQILKANGDVLEKFNVITDPKLPLVLPTNPTLKQLVQLGVVNPESSWPVFTALWQELQQPGRPPIMFALDGLSHVMRESEYISAQLKRIHAHDLSLIRHFVDHLSGQKSLANGGIILGAISQSNAPASPALDHAVKVAEALQQNSENLPRWNVYKKVDERAVDALKDLQDPQKTGLDVLHVGGLSKEEARSIMEYYAESGMLKHTVNDSFVAEKWSLAGMGNIGELERASVRLRL
jgi:small subunit ribosomal protein S29